MPSFNGIAMVPTLSEGPAQNRCENRKVTNKSVFQPPIFERDVIVIVGGYGSGKSEVSVNLARHLARTEQRHIAIADLDIVNPYFRSREAAKQLDQLGIKSLIPPGELSQSELPVIIPEIKSSIQQFDGRLVLDVGGDDAGATVLASLGDAFQRGRYDLLMVLNAYRPFTSDLPGSLKKMGEIEQACGLTFTGLISNSHLIEQTNDEVIYHGLDLTRQVAEKTGLPLVFMSAMREVVAQLDPKKVDCAVLPLERLLLKPWERARPAGND